MFFLCPASSIDVIGLVYQPRARLDSVYFGCSVFPVKSGNVGVILFAVWLFLLLLIAV